MNTTTIDGRADVSVMEIAQEGARNRDELVRKMRGLARSLKEEADRIETHPDHFPLSHGVIQTEGVEIDQMCALLAAQRETLKRLAWITNGTVKNSETRG